MMNRSKSARYPFAESIHSGAGTGDQAPRVASGSAGPARPSAGSTGWIRMTAPVAPVVYPGLPMEFQPSRWRTEQEYQAMRRQELRQAYSGCIRVAYDRFLNHPECQATYVRFTACSVQTPEQAELASEMTHHKVSKLLSVLRWRVTPLIMDVADLIVGAAATQEWERAVNRLLGSVCYAPGEMTYLFGQYDSQQRPESTEAIATSVQYLRAIPPAEARRLRHALWRSREEVEEILFVLWAEAQHAAQTVRLAPQP